MIRTLLISRDPLQREPLAGLLAAWEISSDSCGNAAQAFALMLNAQDKGSPYELILVDQRQLDMDPLQLATSLRAEPRLQDLPLLLISPAAAPERGQQLQLAGYRQVLTTPVDKTQLFNAIHLSARSHTPIETPRVLDLTQRLSQRRSSLPPKEILVAQPDEFARRSLCRMLERAGHHVFSVSNGEDALSALEHHHFDLALVEMELPVINGLQLVKLHHFSCVPQQWVPFVLLAESRSVDLLKQCEQARVCNLLLKPIQGPELLQALTQATESARVECERLASLPLEPAPALATTGVRNSPALDEEVLQSLEQISPAGGFVDRLAQQFSLDGEALLARLEQSLEQGNYSEFKNVVHALIDNSSYLGALTLFEFSSSAAHLGRAGFPENATALAEEVRTAFENARRALTDYLRKSADRVARP